MKNWFYILYIGLMGCLASSCQSSLVEEVQLPPGKMQITFTLALDEPESRSRAEGDWNEHETGDNGVIGSEFENRIDLNTLQVLVYSTDGVTLLGKVANPIVERQQTENGRVYKFRGDLIVPISSIVNGELACRLMVFANSTTVTSLTEPAYNFTNGMLIPMWGVQQCTLQNMEKGEVVDVTQPIYLIRSMAKVEVKLAAEGFTLSSVTVDKYNTTGNVLPTGAASATATENLDTESVFNPNAISHGTNLAFTKVTDKEFYVYLPEYQNVGTDVSPAVISVVIGEKTYSIEFKNYVNGSATDDAYNIVRNHSYLYTITSVNTVEDILLADLEYQSIPWRDVNNGNLNFGNADGDVTN